MMATSFEESKGIDNDELKDVDLESIFDWTDLDCFAWSFANWFDCLTCSRPHIVRSQLAEQNHRHVQIVS